MTTDYTTHEQAHHINKKLVPKYYKGFDSLDHLATYLNDPDTRFWSHRRSSLKDDYSFTGTKNIEEAFDLMQNGWAEGTERLNEIDVTNSQFNAGKVNQQEMNVHGYVPDVPTFLSGNPMCMFARGDNFNPKKQYEVVLQVGYAWFNDANRLFNYGTAALKVIDNLEQMGHRVRVTAAELGKSGGLTSLHEVCLKDYEDPFDINQLAFAICHLSFLRRMMFALKESHTEQEYGRAFSDGYGVAQQLGPDAFTDGVDRIIFAGLAHDVADEFDTLEGAMKITENLLVKNGITDINFTREAA